LNATGAPLSPPAPVTLRLATAATFTGDIAQLRVDVSMRRVAAQIAAEFRDYPDSAAATTVLAPRLVKQTGGGYTLDDFARAFENAFAGATSSLKLATGEDGLQKGQPAPSDASLWAVRMAAQTATVAAAGTGFAYAISGKPVFYAPAPLSTELISKDKPIGCYTYTRETGLSPAPTAQKTFTGIDLDQWARILLGAIDLVLQPRYADPSFIVDWLGGTNYQAAILKAKYNLAGAIVTGVTNILTDPAMTPQNEPAAFADAREKLRQQLLILLGNAYDIDAVVQHPVTVSSGASGAAAPRLYGQPAATLSPTPRDGALAIGSDNASFATSSFKFALAQGTAYLTYPFRAKSAAEQRDFLLDVAYNPTQIEHQIASVPGIDGYVASSWLSFVNSLPPVPVNGGPPKVTVDIPVLLRAYPTPPSMRAQEAIRLNVDAANATDRLRQAKGWNYDFAYDKQRAAQDRVHASVHLNVPKGQGVAAFAETVDLFTALARFTTVYPQIQQTFDEVLSGIALDTATTSDAFKQAALALAAFTKLLGDIGTIWRTWVAQGSSVANFLASRDSEVDFGFVIDETPTPYEKYIALKVTVSYTDVLPSGVTSPQLVFEGYNAVPLPATAETAADAVENAYIYLDANGDPLLYDTAQTISSRRVRIAALDAIQYQNAWSSLQITRNDLLVAGNPTRTPFIYTTPWVSFRNKLAPRLATDKSIPIEEVPTNRPQTRPLVGHLDALFDAFFYESAVDRQLIKLEVVYRYIPGGIATLPKVALPVLLVPASDFTVRGSAATGRRRAASGSDLKTPALASAIKTWFSTNKVSSSGGSFDFSLTAFSALELNTQPLVQIPALTLDIRYISDLN
jgi:hypothetical protein